MCGIIGYRGDSDAGPVLLDGLKNLEYRGYDSAGLVVLDGELDVRKEPGEVAQLSEKHDIVEVDGTVGIGHTRWATHGGVTQDNAHPHTCCTGRVAIVHNGIIENWEDMKDELDGHAFESETDSEVIAHFLGERLESGMAPEEAIAAFMERAEGTFAVAAVDQETGALYGFKRGSPLAVGIAGDDVFLGSDVHAFADHTRDVVFLHEDEYVVISDGPSFYHLADGAVVKEPQRVDTEHASAGKGDYDHHMRKEIHEQPEAVQRLVNALDNGQREELERFAAMLDDAEKVIFTAAGTSYHASLLAVYYLQKAGIEAQTLIASEFRNYERVDDDTLVVAVSQSGETRDTLDAVEYSRERGADIASVVNVPHSSLERASDATLEIQAGKELCVAATKTFTNTVLALLAVAEAAGYDADMGDVARDLRQVIERNEETVREMAAEMQDADDMYIIGRGSTYPISREIALKLKEIPYVHAEGMMGGELKHGTLALIEEGTPVFALVPEEDDEILSNVSEVEARGGDVITISPHTGPFDLPSHRDAFPLYATTIGFLLAYHLGVERGASIDKPRNLAKTVTVR